MEKKMQKRSIVAAILIVLFACITCLAVLFATPNVWEKVSGEGEEDASGNARADAGVLVATVYLDHDAMYDKDNKIYHYDLCAQGWRQAVALAQEAYQNNPNSYVKVILGKDWVATIPNDSTKVNDFGVEEAAFSSGRIWVPKGTNIELDLAGYTIDRNLTKGAVNGQVMLVEGKLAVVDSSTDSWTEEDGGKITGGFNASASKVAGKFPHQNEYVAETETIYGGGIYVHGGTLELYGGSIDGNKIDTLKDITLTDSEKKTYNKATNVYGIGVCIDAGGTFNMYDGRIANHSSTIAKNSVGGGVCILLKGTFTLEGGVIENNTTIVGGGVACYDRTGDATGNKGVINIKGGVIRENTSKRDSSAASVYGGGGIALYGKGEINITNGEIYKNRANNYGGAGIYVVAAVSASSGAATAKLTMTNGNIHHNVAVGSSISGGGIVLRNGAASNKDLSVSAKITGGTIDYNTAIGTAYSYSAAAGAGIYATNATTLEIGGTAEITNNRACYVCTTSAQSAYFKVCSNLEPIVQAYLNGNTDAPEIDQYVSDFGTIGGGVFIGSHATGGVGTFIMSGGKIGNGTGTKEGWTSQGNRAQQGGGVYLSSSPDGKVGAIFKMSGGSIAYNMSHGGAGVRPTQYSETFLSGTAVIKENVQWGKEGDLETIAEVENAQTGKKEIVTTTWKENKNGSLSNLMITASDSRRPHIGKFEKGAEIHLFVGASMMTNGTPFTQEYSVSDEGKRTNSKTITVAGTDQTLTAYANPYNYLISDNVFLSDDYTEQYIIVFDKATDSSGKSYSGELGIYSGKLKFVVEYSNGDKENYVFGEQFKTTADRIYPEWNYIECTYGNEERYPISITAFKIDSQGVESPIEASGENNGTVKNAAGIYTLDIKVNSSQKTDAYASFSIVVHSKALSDKDVTVTLSEDNFVYDGSKKIPTTCTVELKTSLNGQTLLVDEEDYTLSYDNNINAGPNTAKVIVTFKNNFVGTTIKTFSIASSNSDIKMDVTWEYYTGSNWESYNDADWASLTSDLYGKTFTFDGSNQNYKIRAVLSVVANGQQEVLHVYAEGLVIKGDEKQNRSMSLLFDNSDGFVDAGPYFVTIKGDGNYGINPSDREITVQMLQEVITLQASDFASYKVNGNTLWLLQVGEEFTTLLDKASYLDPNATPNEHGEKVRTEQKEGGFARFRDMELFLKLNDSYKFGNGTLSKLLEKADGEPTYSHSRGTKGKEGEVWEITTTALIRFGTNYQLKLAAQDMNGNYSDTYKVDVATRTITLKWTWKIVTISNVLRWANSGAEVLELKLDNWTIGDMSVPGYEFRPEHGSTVIYSYFHADETEPFGQFALIYSNDTRAARREFYEMENGEIMMDRPLNDEFYLFTYNYTLRAGDYKLMVTVPDQAPQSTAHRHWWQNDELQRDYGARYYEFSYTFTFTVNGYALIDDEGNQSEALTITFPDNIFIDYNGKTNNFESVKPVIKLFNLVLVEGVDYILTSSSKDVGEASLTITGINSFSGVFTIEQAYRIEKAQNGWQEVPYIMHWAYSGFLSEVNVIKAVPKLLDDTSDLWFEIASDSAGLNILRGLEHITLDEDGFVTSDVAAILKKLPVGLYYLVGHVKGTDNYYELPSQIIPFEVFKAINNWEGTPSVDTWTEGEYTEDVEHILVSSLFGTAHVMIYNEDGEVYYDSDTGLNLLANAKAGNYTLTAYVDETDNYSGLALYTWGFEVFKKPGLHWWATLVAVVGALGIAALIIFILWKTGVFQIMTEKIVVALRTRASVEATIASVRAAKRMEEGRKSVAEAKRKERLEQLRQKAKEQREMAPEERAALLEAKAKADAERAERLRLRSESALAKAAKMRNDAPDSEDTSEETPDSSNTETDTPTEE